MLSQPFSRVLLLVSSHLFKHSTSTGEAPIRRIADGTAVKVKPLDNTSSPDLTPHDSRAMTIADEHEFTPSAYFTPSPVPFPAKSTSSCSRRATCEVSALTELYLLSRPERSTSTTPVMLSSGMPMGFVKSFLKTGGGCCSCCPTPASGFALGIDVTMAKPVALCGAKQSTAKAAAFMFEECITMLPVVVKVGMGGT